MVLRAILTLAVILSCLTRCRSAGAQVPGGPPLPDPGTHLFIAHGNARVGYYLATRSYRFQGEYTLTYNIARLGYPVYVFGDVDVEAISDIVHNFAPDRQTGTFEIGAREVLGVRPLELFLRHQSPHNIDRADRRQGSWEMIGGRWQQPYRGGLLTLSVGTYIHRIVNDYQSDLRLDGFYPIGHFLGKRWEIAGNIHHVVETGPRGGFTDFWIEPRMYLSDHLKIFVGAGQVHYIDVFGGKTDLPVVGGIEIGW